MSLDFSGYYTYVVQNPALYKELLESTDNFAYISLCSRFVGKDIYICLPEISYTIKKLEEIKLSNSGEDDANDLHSKADKLIDILQKISDHFIDKENIYTKIDERVRFQFSEVIFKNESTY